MDGELSRKLLVDVEIKSRQFSRDLTTSAEV
jgi:hypothetical protein